MIPSLAGECRDYNAATTTQRRAVIRRTAEYNAGSGPTQTIYINTYTYIVESVLKPVRWVGSSRRDLKNFPKPVQRDMGQALYAAQCGEEYPSVKALKGFGGRAVLEIVASHEGAAYRAVYTVRFQDAVYVLHAFQKKSKKGIATPPQEIELVKQRLATAEQDYRERQN
jgi:phage-related protein